MHVAFLPLVQQLIKGLIYYLLKVIEKSSLLIEVVLQQEAPHLCNGTK